MKKLAVEGLRTGDRKEMRFIVGQKIVCLKKDDWTDYLGSINPSGPKFNDVVTVQSYRPYGTFIVLEEYDPVDAFNEKWFAPSHKKL